MQLVVGMLVLVGLAVAIVIAVALPQLRDGATLLSPEGERLAATARDRAGTVAEAAKDVVGQVAGTMAESAGAVVGQVGTVAVAARDRAAAVKEKLTGELPAVDGDADPQDADRQSTDEPAGGTASGIQSGVPGQNRPAAATPAPGNPVVLPTSAERDTIVR